MAQYRILLKNPVISLLLLGSLISGFGDRLTEFGLAWYVLGRTQNSLDVGLTFLIFQLPAVFSGVLAGWLLDRFRREAIMLADNLLRGFLVGAVPVLDGLGVLSLPLLYLLIAIIGAFSVATIVGSRTLITDIVDPAYYNLANSLLVAQTQITAIAGPGLAGILIYLLGPLTLLWIDSCTFFFFALVLGLLLRKPPARLAEINSTGGVKQTLSQLLGGAAFAFKSPVILSILIISYFWNGGLGIYQVALPFFCNEPLGVGAAGMGLALSLYSFQHYLLHWYSGRCARATQAE